MRPEQEKFLRMMELGFQKYPDATPYKIMEWAGRYTSPSRWDEYRLKYTTTEIARNLETFLVKRDTSNE
jgi:hypothetical protein